MLKNHSSFHQENKTHKMIQELRENASPAPHQETIKYTSKKFSKLSSLAGDTTDQDQELSEVHSEKC